MSDFFVMPHTPARILRVGFTLCSGIFIYNKCICCNVARCQRNNHSQDASDCGVIYITPLFVSSQTKRAYYMLKRRLQIVCEDTNESSEVFKTSYVYPVEFRFIGIFNRSSNSNIMNQTSIYGQALTSVTKKYTLLYCE